MWFLFFSLLIWWSTLILKWWARLASWDKIHVDVIYFVHIVGFHLLIFCWEFWHLLSWRILFFVVLSLSHFKIKVMLIFYMSWEVFSPLFSVSDQPHACTGWGFTESFMGFFPQAPSRHDFLHSLQLPESHFPSSWHFLFKFKITDFLLELFYITFVSPFFHTKNPSSKEYWGQ